MLSMLRTDALRTNLFNQSFSQMSNDDQLFDHLSCPLHPGFKLQALCPKESFQPSLLCIKCMIDPEIEKRMRSETLIAIQDIINRATKINELDVQSQADRDVFKNKIVDFSSKDYLDSFERHTDTQMKKLRQEIERVKESLNELESQFKKLFEKQHKYLKSHEDELKKRINEYIVDQEQLQRFLNLTYEDMLDTIKKITNVKEYEKFIKVLYHRGSPDQRAIESSMINGIMEVMDDLIDKVNKMKTYKIGTSMLEEIRQKIESIEAIDQSFQAISIDLNPRLIQTLEKVHEVEDKRKIAIKSPKIEYISEPVEKIIPKKTDMFACLKERLASFSKRDLGGNKTDDEMQTENTTNFESNSKKEKKIDQDPFHRFSFFSQNGSRTEEKPINHKYFQSTSNEKITQRADVNNVSTNKTSNQEEYYRTLDNDQVHRRQKTDLNSYRRITERKPNESYLIQEEYGDSNDLYCDSGEFTFREGFRLDQSAERRSKSPHKYKEQSSTAKMQKFEYFGEDHNDHHKRDKHNENGKYRRGPKSRDFQDGVDADDSNGDGKLDSIDTENSNSNTPKKIERVKGLHDWINRRLTGYLVFQNSIHGELEREYEGDHLNRVAGQKWRSMTKTEKEVYKNIAMKARVQLKKEFKDVGKESPELEDLQEIVEKRIRKIKKQ